VAAFEGDNLPFYGVQFHPEKIEFVPPSRYEPNIPRTPHAAALSRHLGSFLVSEAAKSLHPASCSADPDRRQPLRLAVPVGSVTREMRGCHGGR